MEDADKSSFHFGPLQEKVHRTFAAAPNPAQETNKVQALNSFPISPEALIYRYYFQVLDPPLAVRISENDHLCPLSALDAFNHCAII